MSEELDTLRATYDESVAAADQAQRDAEAANERSLELAKAAHAAREAYDEAYITSLPEQTPAAEVPEDAVATDDGEGA